MSTVDPFTQFPKQSKPFRGKIQDPSSILACGSKLQAVLSMQPYPIKIVSLIIHPWLSNIVRVFIPSQIFEPLLIWKNQVGSNAYR